MKLADTEKEFLRKFWKMSNHNITYIWAYDYADMVDIWYMNEKEFKKFTKQFGVWDGYAKKIRFKICNNKINEWLEAQI